MTNELLGIKNKVALVVGAASGYGRQCALTLAKHGAVVALADRDEAGLEETRKLIANETTQLFPTDISEVANCDKLVEDVVASLGILDILVHTAAVLQSKLPDEVDEDHWNKTINVNLRSQFFITRTAIKHMRTNNWGRVVNFISTAGLSGGLPPSIIYGISKSGALAMTKSFARQNSRYGVLVNALSPATLDTPLFRRGMSESELVDLKEQHIKINAYGRWIDPTEVANSVLFLCSEMSSAVTGHVLRADAGAELSGF
jgi:meso-butanediol dehydrogenase/(S,S)-butanediol dehydrogenase/diacetyl reductase